MVLSACSWGTAALGWLYRQLCYACQRTRASSCVAGCLLLLQHWMWLRIPVGRPAWVERRQWVSDHPERKPTAAYLYDTSGVGVGRREALYLAYTNEMDSLQPAHVRSLLLHLVAIFVPMCSCYNFWLSFSQRCVITGPMGALCL